MKDEHPSIEKSPWFRGWLKFPKPRGLPSNYGEPVRNYNPALCLLPGGSMWIVWRVEFSNGLSQLACGVLDPARCAIEDPRWLDVGEQNPEDPRLIRCGDAVWLNYLDVKFARYGFTANQVVRRVDPDLQEVVGERIIPPIGKNGTGIEKNWTMFEVPGQKRPLLNYSPETGGVYTLEGEEVVPPEVVPWKHPGGSWSGRSQAHLIGDRYVAIGGGAYYWPRHLKRYFLSAWAFESHPPYRMTEVSRQPLLWASEEDDRIPSPRDPRHRPCVVFTGGAQPVPEGWLVPVGVHDSRMALLSIPFERFNLVAPQELRGEVRRQSYQEAREKKAPRIEVRKFRPMANPPDTPRAIVYPWKHDASAWEELRYSLRSVAEFFEDTECPIYILGTNRPNFLLFENQTRVRFLHVWSYWEALAQGVQLASKVMWMNDDVFLLRHTTWEDCEGGKYLDVIDPRFTETAGPQSNPWKQSIIDVFKSLRQRGVEEFRVYSTHTPYVFDRRNAVAVLNEFGVWDKMPFELAYFHLHGQSRKMGEHEKAMQLPFGKARFLNVVDHTLTPEMKQAIADLLPDYAPWELKRAFVAR